MKDERPRLRLVTMPTRICSIARMKAERLWN